MGTCVSSQGTCVFSSGPVWEPLSTHLLDLTPHSTMGNALDKLRTLKNDIANSRDKREEGASNGAAKEDQSQGATQPEGGEGEGEGKRVEDVAVVEDKGGEGKKTGEVVAPKETDAMEERKAEEQVNQVVLSLVFNKSLRQCCLYCPTCHSGSVVFSVLHVTQVMLSLVS